MIFEKKRLQQQIANLEREARSLERQLAAALEVAQANQEAPEVVVLEAPPSPLIPPARILCSDNASIGEKEGALAAMRAILRDG